jgi:virulence-associated protein VagC
METVSVTLEGDLQTVRLPKGFHLPATTVSVRHDGDAIVLEPIKAKSWPEHFFELIHISDDAFIRPPQGNLPPVKVW